MEDHQTTTQEKPDESRIQPSHSRHRWQDAAVSHFLHELIQHRPLLVWMGVGAFLFTIIYTSLLSIFQPRDVKHEELEPTPALTTNPSHPSSQTGSSVPLWLLVGVTVGGVVGSIAIARKMQSSRQFSQLYQRFQSATTRAIARRQRRKLLLRSQQQMLSTSSVASKPADLEQPPLEPAQLVAQENFFLLEERSLDLVEELTEQSPVEETEETIEILIVLDEQSPSLELEREEEKALVSGPESLAEMLDLRKKLPLSAILGESNFQ